VLLLPTSELKSNRKPCTAPILTNGELAAALLSLPEKNREIIFLYFFGHYTQREYLPLKTNPLPMPFVSA